MLVGDGAAMLVRVQVHLVADQAQHASIVHAHPNRLDPVADIDEGGLLD
jgi:hypothetical protein